MSHPSIRAKRLTRVAGGLFVALATWAAWGAGGDIADPAAGVAIDIEPHERFRLRVRADAGQRDWLSAKGYDIAGHDLPNDRVEVLTDRPGLERLKLHGFVVEILEVRHRPVPLGGDPDAPGTDIPLGDTLYTDPGELEVFLDQVVLDHPGITRLEALGTTEQGRTIWGLLISDNAVSDEDELSILFSGAHHAREVMSPQVVMDTIDYLTDNYGSNMNVTGWVDDYQIWCVPIVNPDGVNIVFTSNQDWRKNARDNDSSGTVNGSDGVDLNRNYEWGWGDQCQGSEPAWSSPLYRGPSEGSEPEIQAMVGLGRRIRPVFDVEYHSYGEDVFYATSCDPDSFSPRLTTITTGPDSSISRVIAEAYAGNIEQADGGSGFFAAPYGSRVDGVGRDQQYHENGAIAFVTEVNSSSEGGFRPSYTTWRDATVEGQRFGWQWLLNRLAGPAVGGWVLDAVTQLPVEADLSLDEMQLPDGKRLTSRSDTGRFHIIVVSASYTLRVSAPGYVDETVNLFASGSFSPLQVLLTPTGASQVLFEDFETAGSVAQWTVGDPGDDATSGLWVWDEPHGTHSGDVQGANLEFGNARFDRTPGEGKHAFVTGNALNAVIGADDVDSGVATVTSPSYDLSGLYGVELSWHRWFRKDAADPVDDLVTQVSAGGGPWITLENLGSTTATADASPAWVPTSVRLDDFVAPDADIRLRFRASDTAPDNTVEAAIDDLEIRGYSRATQGELTGLILSGGATAVLDWNNLIGAPDAVFDVVRGSIDQLGGSVDLGALTCIENDSVDPSTLGDADTATPAPGSGFFYLVRFELGFSVGGFGQGSDGGTRSGSGGCAP